MKYLDSLYYFVIFLMMALLLITFIDTDYFSEIFIIIATIILMGSIIIINHKYNKKHSLKRNNLFAYVFFITVCIAAIYTFIKYFVR